MNVYDEAIKKLNEFRNRHYNDIDEELRDIAQALNVVLPQNVKNNERAKKVEKLLKYQSNYIDSIIDSLNVIIEKSKLSQEMLEKELEELK